MNILHVCRRHSISAPAARGRGSAKRQNHQWRSRSRHGSAGGEEVGGVVRFICRLEAVFLARRLQAAVAAGAAVAAAPGGGWGKGRGKKEERSRFVGRRR